MPYTSARPNPDPVDPFGLTHGSSARSRTSAVMRTPGTCPCSSLATAVPLAANTTAADGKDSSIAIRRAGLRSEPVLAPSSVGESVG
jgi:hypothetical protein